MGIGRMVLPPVPRNPRDQPAPAFSPQLRNRPLLPDLQTPPPDNPPLARHLLAKLPNLDRPRRGAHSNQKLIARPEPGSPGASGPRPSTLRRHLPPGLPRAPALPGSKRRPRARAKPGLKPRALPASSVRISMPDNTLGNRLGNRPDNRPGSRPDTRRARSRNIATAPRDRVAGRAIRSTSSAPTNLRSARGV